MSKDKVYLVPVTRLAPEFLLRIADQSVTADGEGCCGCEKPFGRAGRIAGAMIALNPGGGEEAAAITFLCLECGSRRAEVCRRLNVEPVESSPDDQKFWNSRRPRRDGDSQGLRPRPCRLCSRLRRGGRSLDPDALTESKPRKEREPRCLQTSKSPTSAFPCPIYLMAGSKRSACENIQGLT